MLKRIEQAAKRLEKAAKELRAANRGTTPKKDAWCVAVNLRDRLETFTDQLEASIDKESQKYHP